ncbi:MAG: hypothetical protein M3O70_14130 [Actinomycetota bacterium]|nr:hypothetical protein [Actinomycetota bacterium]
MLPHRLRVLAFALLVAALAALQAHTTWQYRGDQVDESELVHYAVGFFGGDFDPHWYGYGSLGMYLLFIIYAVLAGPALLFGPLDSLDAYAQQLFHNGYFFIVARYVFAVVGLLTVLVYAKITDDAKVPRLLIGGYAIVAVTGTDAILFANYLRTDHLVSLFVALALLCFLRSSKPTYLYGLAVAVAAAIATKVSALPLVLGLAAAGLYRWRRGEAGSTQLVLSGVLFVGCLWAFQPYVDYPDLLRSLSRAVAEPGSWSKTYHYSLGDRVAATISVFRQYVGLPTMMLPLGLAFARARRAVVASCLFLLLLLVAPYAMSPEITYYWFAPAFGLLRFMALLGAASVLDRVRERLPGLGTRRWAQLAGPMTATGCLALIVAGPVASWAGRIATHAARPTSNAQLAATWLEANALGEIPIQLDVQFNYVLPKVYDPANLPEAKRISRAFIFERDNNTYLNRIFEDYLRGSYAVRHRLPPQPARLRAVRVDPAAEAGSRLRVDRLRLCRDGQDSCLTLPRVTTNKDLQPGTAGDGELQVVGPDPHLVAPTPLLPADGSVTLRFNVAGEVGRGGQVFFDYGRGFGGAAHGDYGPGTDVAVRVGGAAPGNLVTPLEPFDVLKPARIDRLSGSYVVTSPAIYMAFLDLDPNQQPPERARTLRVVQSYYRFLLEQPLIERFEAGTGAPVEVYRPGPVGIGNDRQGQSPPARRRTGAGAGG